MKHLHLFGASVAKHCCAIGCSRPKNIGAKGYGTVPETLLSTEVMYDVGKAMYGVPNNLWVGVQYQYWRNKFGNPHPLCRMRKRPRRWCVWSTTFNLAGMGATDGMPFNKGRAASLPTHGRHSFLS